MSSNDANNQAAITGHAHGNWPRFELVRFPQPAGDLADLALPLLKHGAPKALFGNYRALNELRIVDIPDYGKLVCFGIAGLSELICLNPLNGAILAVVTDVPYKSSFFENDMQFLKVNFVNSSLELFIASVRVLYDRFPFDEATTQQRDTSNDEFDALDAAWQSAARDLKQTLKSIDPPAIERMDAFWYELLWDIRNGDYETQSILANPD